MRPNIFTCGWGSRDLAASELKTRMGIKVFRTDNGSCWMKDTAGHVTGQRKCEQDPRAPGDAPRLGTHCSGPPGGRGHVTGPRARRLCDSTGVRAVPRRRKTLSTPHPTDCRNEKGHRVWVRAGGTEASSSEGPCPRFRHQAWNLAAVSFNLLPAPRLLSSSRCPPGEVGDVGGARSLQEAAQPKDAAVRCPRRKHAKPETPTAPAEGIKHTHSMCAHTTHIHGTWSPEP